jgi:hypothetical protein
MLKDRICSCRSKAQNRTILRAVMLRSVDRARYHFLKQKLLLSILGALFLICGFSHLEAGSSYAQFSSLQTQVPPTSKPTPVIMDSMQAIKNFDIVPKKDKLVAKEAGTYFIIASGQAGAVSNTATGYVDMWFTKNDVALPNSNCRISIDHSLSIRIVVSQFVVQLNAGDTVATIFSASGPSLGFIYSNPSNEPAVSSFLFSIFKLE